MTLKGFINFLLKIKLIISYMYLNIINEPANIEASIEILLDSKYCITNRVNANDNKIEKDIGVEMNLRLMLLDHFESTEKNKKIAAKTTIGINIAL
jgi:hypothetical protein|tara:strand:- start:53 stop:340 length:288 start_codon:yes stop_codon:yes gene_type:complete